MSEKQSEHTIRGFGLFIYNHMVHKCSLNDFRADYKMYEILVPLNQTEEYSNLESRRAQNFSILSV